MSSIPTQAATVKLTGTAKDNRLILPESQHPAPVLGPSLLVPMLVLCITTGFLAIHSGIATISGNELSRPRSLFIAINAATLTGFTDTRPLAEYTAAGQTIIFLLTLAGTLFSFIAGGLAVSRIAKMRHSDKRICLWAIGLTLFVGGGALYDLPRKIGSAGFLALSALGNSGLCIGKLPTPDSPQIPLVLLPLSILGGLGIPVLLEIFDRLRGGPGLSRHSSAALRWTAGVYVVAIILLVLIQWPGSVAPAQTWRTLIANSSREAINSRSAGFSFTFATFLPRAVQWILIGLMLIGGTSGGTAGGLKVTTLATLSRGIRSTFIGQSLGKVAGIAAVWLLIYFAMIAGTLLALLMTEQQIPPDRLLFLATSAIGNVGLSHDPVTLSDVGMYITAAAMLCGRIVPILILWWMVDTTDGENIAIG